MGRLARRLLDEGYEGDPTYVDYVERPPSPANPALVARACTSAAAGDEWAQEYVHLARRYDGLRNAYGIALRQRSELAERRGEGHGGVA